LHGVPVTVKDTIDTEGLRTAAGSRLLKRHVPSRDAPAVARLRAAGAIILGKTNVSELATAYDANNPVFGRFQRRRSGSHQRVFVARRSG
jgi:amidase